MSRIGFYLKEQWIITFDRQLLMSLKTFFYGRAF